jgi:hypothetical protein
MKLETAQAIVQAAYANDLRVSLRADYSGRGMFGKTTAAVVGSRADITEAIFYASKEELPSIKWDNMGLDMVAY